jgi:quercetin dioxygenase-like cupin family protein
MQITKSLSRGLFAGLCFASGMVVTVALGETSFPPVEVLVSSSQTILGQTFDYPAGQATVTAAIVTLQPGQSTGSHMHEAPLFVMVLEGEVTVDYGQGVTKRYVKDDAFLEAYKSNHNGTNTGSVPVRILTVYAGSDSVKNTVMEE